MSDKSLEPKMTNGDYPEFSGFTRCVPKHPEPILADKIACGRITAESHPGLPVKGYKPTQPDWAVELVNENKALEEFTLRQIDKHTAIDGVDQRCVALARTSIQEAFMWLNRGVFRPERLKGELTLPRDITLNGDV